MRRTKDRGKYVKPKPGQLVAIELERGGFALAWLTHVGTGRRPFIISRFFSHRFDAIPDRVDAIEHVTTSEPAIVGRTGDLGLRDGLWTRIGKPYVPVEGFALPSLLEYTNIGTPAVVILNEETYNGMASRPAIEEDLERELGTGDIMGHIFISRRLDRIIDGAPANSGRPGELFAP